MTSTFLYHQAYFILLITMLKLFILASRPQEKLVKRFGASMDSDVESSMSDDDKAEIDKLFVMLWYCKFQSGIRKFFIYTRALWWVVLDSTFISYYQWNTNKSVATLQLLWFKHLKNIYQHKVYYSYVKCHNEWLENACRKKMLVPREGEMFR